MDELFSFPDADLYQHVYTPAPPSDLSKSILSLPTEIIVDIAQSNFKTALALMCTNRVLHAAGVTALYTRAYLNGSMFQVRNPDAPNLVVPGVLGGLLAKQEHTAALRYLKVLSLPYDTYSRPAFMTLVYRVFERAHGLVYVHLLTWNEFEPAPSPRNNLLQPLYPRNLHTLDLCSPTIPFAQTLLTAPSLKEVRFSHEFYYWQSLLGYDQGPYSQVTSLRYVHRGVEARTMDNVFVEPLTMNDEFLKMCELFPSVERMEVEIVELRNFLDCVPHMGNPWARVKHLCLVYTGGEFDEGHPLAHERTKVLLMWALNALCPALDTGEVRLRSRGKWVGYQRMST